MQYVAMMLLAVSGEVVVHKSDIGTTVVLTGSQTLTIELPAITSAGMDWFLVSHDKMTFVKRDSVPSVNVGGTDLEKFLLVGTQSGNTVISFEYRTPDGGTLETFHVYVKITEPFSGVMPRITQQKYQPLIEVTPETSPLPKSYNFCGNEKDFRLCTPVKNQGGCGSCWAFATVAVVENLMYNQNMSTPESIRPDLSEQYLVSCNTHKWGCKGGWAAFDFYTGALDKSNNQSGIVYTYDFKYTGTDAKCASNYTKYGTIHTWGYLEKGSTTPVLKQALLDHGPLWATVCTGGGQFSVPNPQTDIFTGTGRNCTNHAVVIVGWNDNDGNGYWIVRNSWGTWWGNKGYMRIAYGANSIGLVAAYATPNKPTPGPKPPPGCSSSGLGPVAVLALCVVVAMFMGRRKR